MAEAKRSTKRGTAAEMKYAGFTAEERDAMKEHAKDLRKSARRGPAGDKAADESDVLAKIAEMSEPDRALAERVHAVILASAPELSPKLWYGMPAYARNGKVVCHFQPAEKFKSRYATFGFSDQANLDEGHVWPVAFALTTLTAADEKRLGALVKNAVS